MKLETLKRNTRKRFGKHSDQTLQLPSHNQNQKINHKPQ